MQTVEMKGKMKENNDHTLLGEKNDEMRKVIMKMNSSKKIMRNIE